MRTVLLFVETNTQNYIDFLDFIIARVLFNYKPEIKAVCSKLFLSKLVYAEVSKTTSASKKVFHQTVHAQNSMLSKEIHDQGIINKFKVLTFLYIQYIRGHTLECPL